MNTKSTGIEEGACFIVILICCNNADVKSTINHDIKRREGRNFKHVEEIETMRPSTQQNAQRYKCTIPTVKIDNTILPQYITKRHKGKSDWNLFVTNLKETSQTTEEIVIIDDKQPTSITSNGMANSLPEITGVNALKLVTTNAPNTVPHTNLVNDFIDTGFTLDLSTD